jgi:hypothetical protein
MRPGTAPVGAIEVAAIGGRVEAWPQLHRAHLNHPARYAGAEALHLADASLRESLRKFGAIAVVYFLKNVASGHWPAAEY